MLLGFPELQKSGLLTLLSTISIQFTILMKCSGFSVCLSLFLAYPHLISSAHPWWVFICVSFSVNTVLDTNDQVLAIAAVLCTVQFHWRVHKVQLWWFSPCL